MELNIKRKVEIEAEFAKLLNIFENRDKALTDMILKVKTIEESEYLYEAYLMPIEEISKEIKRYDSGSPRLDAVKFVDNLKGRYNVDRRTIVKRIQNVRRISRYLRENNMVLNQTNEDNSRRK